MAISNFYFDDERAAERAANLREKFGKPLSQEMYKAMTVLQKSITNFADADNYFQNTPNIAKNNHENMGFSGRS
jgi:hypothetical protein